MNSRKIKHDQSSDYKMKQFSSLPSCFLTPESAEKPNDFGRVTPTMDRSSSVFMSPPSSLERKTVPNFAEATQNDPLKVELNFEDQGSASLLHDSRASSLPTFRIIGSKSGRSKIDFITELVELNCEQICKIICGYLGDLDLCRFASVSKEWRTFIGNESHVHDRWRTYLRQRKEYYDRKGKENLGSPSSLKDMPSSKTERTPLLNLDINLKPQRQLPPKNVSKQSTARSSTESTQRTPTSATYRPCPKCSSPSLVEVFDNYCQCQKCELKYCAVCLRDMKYHKGKPCEGLDEPQDRKEKRTRTRKKGMDQVVGSKHNRDRIRRL